MKLKDRFLGLLSLADIRDSATVKAITKLAQRFSGIKTLIYMATSPNSADDIEDMPATEVLTRKAMNKYLEALAEPQGFVTVDAPDDEDSVIVFPVSGNPSPGTYSVTVRNGAKAARADITIPPANDVSYALGGRIGTRVSF